MIYFGPSYFGQQTFGPYKFRTKRFRLNDYVWECAQLGKPNRNPYSMACETRNSKVSFSLTFSAAETKISTCTEKSDFCL